MTDRVDINNLLQEMRSLKSQTEALRKPEGLEAGGLNPLKEGEGGKSVPSFGEMMERAINSVNETQQASSELKEAYERGEPGVDITDVMVASQKASVSFEAAVQVRNKLVEAYRDVMNMPI